jgi:hypothetical protein
MHGTNIELIKFVFEEPQIFNINETHGSKSKIPSKISSQAAFRGWI